MYPPAFQTNQTQSMGEDQEKVFNVISKRRFPSNCAEFFLILMTLLPATSLSYSVTFHENLKAKMKSIKRSSQNVQEIVNHPFFQEVIDSSTQVHLFMFCREENLHFVMYSRPAREVIIFSSTSTYLFDCELVGLVLHYGHKKVRKLSPITLHRYSASNFKSRDSYESNFLGLQILASYLKHAKYEEGRLVFNFNCSCKESQKRHKCFSFDSLTSGRRHIVGYMKKYFDGSTSSQDFDEVNICFPFYCKAMLVKDIRLGLFPYDPLTQDSEDEKFEINEIIPDCESLESSPPQNEVHDSNLFKDHEEIPIKTVTDRLLEADNLKGVLLIFDKPNIKLAVKDLIEELKVNPRLLDLWAAKAKMTNTKFMNIGNFRSRFNKLLIKFKCTAKFHDKRSSKSVQKPDLKELATRFNIININHYRAGQPVTGSSQELQVPEVGELRLNSPAAQMDTGSDSVPGPSSDPVLEPVLVPAPVPRTPQQKAPVPSAAPQPDPTPVVPDPVIQEIEPPSQLQMAVINTAPDSSVSGVPETDPIPEQVVLNTNAGPTRLTITGGPVITYEILDPASEAKDWSQFKDWTGQAIMEKAMEELGDSVSNIPEKKVTTNISRRKVRNFSSKVTKRDPYENLRAQFGNRPMPCYRLEEMDDDPIAHLRNLKIHGPVNTSNK